MPLYYLTIKYYLHCTCLWNSGEQQLSQTRHFLFLFLVHAWVFLKLRVYHGNHKIVNNGRWKLYRCVSNLHVHLTIIPQVRMGYESIAHEAKGRIGYWLRDHEGERNNCFSKIHLVGQKNIETKHLSQAKARHHSFFTTKTLQIWWALFATSSSTNQNAALMIVH